MSEALTLKLRKKVNLEGMELSELQLCEPNAGQLEKASFASTGVAANIILISEVAKVPMAAVRLLSKRDLEAAVRYLSGFQDAP